MWPPRNWKLQLIYLMPLIVGFCRDDKLFHQLAKLEAGGPFLKGYARADVVIKFETMNEYGQANGHEGQALADVLVHFQEYSRKTAREIREMDRSWGGMTGWVKKQLFDEARQLPDSARYLTAREYPELVRRVARFSDEE